MSETQYDAIVIGGGPGGSTVSALLAEHGHRVLLLEREPFPRYHIGESLIPYTWFTLNRLGVVDWLHKSACPKKYSVQFVSITGKVSQPFYFFQTIKHECAQTWQVWRGEFDQMLLDNSRAKGVEVRQNVTVRDVLMEGSRVVGVRADVKDGVKGQEIRATRRRRRHRPRFAAVAQVRLEGPRPGSEQDRRVELLQRARCAIPASTRAPPPSPTCRRRAGSGTSRCTPTSSASASSASRRISIATRAIRQSIFAREAEACAWIRDHIRVGTQVEPVRVTGEYSYHSKRIGGDGFCLVGDAFAFLDPLFSTGVFLALKGGEMAADAIHAGLAGDGTVTAAHFDEYYARQRHAVVQLPPPGARVLRSVIQFP